MKRFQISLTILLLTTLTVCSMPAAAVAEVQTFQRQSNPKADLIRIVTLLPELEKDEELALTKDQAEKILWLIKEYLVIFKKEELVPRKELNLDNAREILSEFEKILSDEQLDSIDQLAVAQVGSRQPQGDRTGKGQRVAQSNINPFFADEAQGKLLMDLVAELDKKLCQ